MVLHRSHRSDSLSAMIGSHRRHLNAMNSRSKCSRQVSTHKAFPSVHTAIWMSTWVHRLKVLVHNAQAMHVRNIASTSPVVYVLLDAAFNSSGPHLGLYFFRLHLHLGL